MAIQNCDSGFAQACQHKRRRITQAHSPFKLRQVFPDEKIGHLLSELVPFVLQFASVNSVGPSSNRCARMRAKKNDCRRASPITQYSSALAFHRADGWKSDQSRCRRGLQSNRRRNGNPDASVRAGPKTNNDFFRKTEFFADELKVFKKRSGIFPIVCPFAHQIGIVLSARPCCRARWKVRAQEFSFRLIIALVFRFHLKRNPCAWFGTNSGNRSAHSMTETPSPKK